MEKRTELVVRALVEKNGMILLCRLKGKKWYYFPGGLIEFEEDAETAIRREMEEEAGVSLENVKFAGAMENAYIQDEKVAIHEINIVFSADIADEKVVSREDHNEFLWMPIDEFKNSEVLPLGLRDSAFKRLKGDGGCIWKAQMEL